MTRRQLRATTLVELLVALGVLAVLIGVWWGVVGMMRKGEQKLTDRACAMAAAELSIARLSMDVKSMLPPEPFRPEHCPQLSADGTSLAFLRCERTRGGMAARRVAYELKPLANQRFQLVRDGHPLAGAVLASFSVRLVTGPHGEPRFRVRLSGASGPELHPVELELALPPPGPASIVGLPPAANKVLEGGVRCDI